MQKNIIECISEKLKSIKDDFNFKFTLGVSTIAPNLTDLYRLYKECRAAVSMKVEFGYEQVIYFERLENRLLNPHQSNKEILKELVTRIATKVIECEDFSEDIIQITSIISTMEGLKLEKSKSVFISLFNTITNHMQSNGENFEKVVGDDIDVLNYIIGAKIIPDIIKYVNDTLYLITSYYISSKTNKDGPIVEKILKILNNDYDKPITLTYLSDRIYLSPNYLRILFKNKMNISIQDYLINVRMSKAKEFLKQNRYKVYEIGEMVGYPNSTYFSIVFKNYVNLTPGEYISKYYTTEGSRDK